LAIYKTILIIFPLNLQTIRYVTHKTKTSAPLRGRSARGA